MLKLIKPDGTTTTVVTAVTGRIFEVDTSDEACRRFGTGVRSGARILYELGPNDILKGTVAGVAPHCGGSGTRKRLWVAFDGDEGRVSFFSDIEPTVLSS